MFILKCKSCGFEQVVKKCIDRDIYYELTNNEGLYCDRKCCDGRRMKVPNGYIMECRVLGGWAILRQATLEEYKSIKRAREIRDIGLKSL